MGHASTYDTIIQQAGTTEMGDMNTNLPNHLLQTAVLTQGSADFHQVQPGKPTKSISTRLINLFANLIWKTERVYTNLAQATQ